MSSTPRRSKKFFRTVKKQETKNKPDDEELTTPVHSTPNSKHPDSPLYFPLTQESENEVVWDWQSPRQNKTIKKTKPMKKRPDEGSRSPSLAVPFKRKNLFNKINNLKEKLDAINQQINRKIISNGKSDEIRQEIAEIKTENKNDLENLLEDDDALVDVLIECSQRVENEYLRNHQTEIKVQTPKIRNNNLNIDSKFGDDSFDLFLETVEDDVLESLSQVPCKINADRENAVIKVQSVNVAEQLPYSLQNCAPNGHNQNYETEHKTSNFARTNSFEIDANSCSPPLKCTPDEIEKKRRDALAKRERKMMERPKSSMGIDGEVTPSRKFQRRNYSFEIPSPSASKHKSPHPISSERLNEIGQDEVKDIKDWERIQKEIEKKRQEAILRLQRKRIKK